MYAGYYEGYNVYPYSNLLWILGFVALYTMCYTIYDKMKDNREDGSEDTDSSELESDERICVGSITDSSTRQRRKTRDDTKRNIARYGASDKRSRYLSNGEEIDLMSARIERQWILSVRRESMR